MHDNKNKKKLHPALLDREVDPGALPPYPHGVQVEEDVVEHDQRLLPRRRRIACPEPGAEDPILGQRAAELTAAQVFNKGAQLVEHGHSLINAACWGVSMSNLSLPDSVFPTGVIRP